MKHYLLYIIFFFLSAHAVRAEILKDDTTKVDVRTFDTKKIEEFRNNPKYNYTTKESWLKAAWNKLLDWLANLFGTSTRRAANNAGGGEILNALIAAAAIVLLIFGLSKVKFRTWISGKGAKVEQEYEVEEENIHDIDFYKDIKEAEDAGDYRRAIRLLFLKVLKNLSDAELIYWDPNKTNYQYLYELKGTNIYEPFVKCVQTFDRVWYGEWKIDRGYYQENKLFFDELAKSSLKIKTAVFNG